MAAKAEEVAGISEWKGSSPVPSRTPFISAVVRQDQVVLPVFALSELLRVSVQGTPLYCLTAKHPRGNMALCIDGDMPILHTLELAAMRPYSGREFESFGSFSSGLDEVPILSLSKLGSVS